MNSHASMISVAALMALEKTVNAALALDPFTVERLASFEGKVIAVEIKGSGLSLYMAPQKNGLRLMGSYDGPVDTTLRGAPLGLLRMSTSRPGEGLFSGEVTIEGDIETGQKLQRIFQGLDIDWEEHISRLTGDVVGHQIGQLVRSLGNFTTNAVHNLSLDMGEYLQEESRMVPTRIELEQFVSDVDRLRMATDRLEARITRLHKQLHDPDNTSPSK